MSKVTKSDHTELINANRKLALQNEEREKRAAELILANIELGYQNLEKQKRAEELTIANIELAFQKAEKETRAAELIIANKELVFQQIEKQKRLEELVRANDALASQKKQNESLVADLFTAHTELSFQKEERGKRAAELTVADKELAFQKEEKGKRAAELNVADIKLALQDEEKGQRAAELGIAKIELAYQDEEKGKRAAELIVVNKELVFQNDEREKRAAELSVANKELAFQNKEKEKRAAELSIANVELAYQNDEKEKRAEELTIANKELALQNQVKEKRAAELIIANEELAFQNKEKENRAAELLIANKELAYQNNEKEKRAAELSIANIELAYQNDEKVKRAAELFIVNKELVFQTREKEKRAAELAFADIELAFQNKEKLKLEIANREREQTLSYAEGILGTMREPLLVLDKNLRVKSANEAFYRTFSITLKEAVTTLVYELKNLNWDTPQLREALEKILPQKSAFNDLEVVFDLPILGEKVMLLNARRLIQSEQGEELILLALQDITEQRALQKRNDSFMSMASHELKTPVTTIKTLIQILQQQYRDSNDATLVNYLTAINHQIEQLTKLVVDLLDVSKIKAEKFQLEEKVFDFDTLVLETVKSCQLLSAQHTIFVQGKSNAHISGDRNSISRVFINLITNAIKYSPKANSIGIIVSRTKTAVRVGVRDNGIGIAPTHQDRIFERFFQVGNERGQSFAGLGIGLYITSAIVAQHRGRIWVESTEGKGSTFFFEFPVSESAEISSHE